MAEQIFKHALFEHAYKEMWEQLMHVVIIFIKLKLLQYGIFMANMMCFFHLLCRV